ncbi:MAG: hypothetical protein IIA83_04305 [Thaumarchaeota archaeon]|nr:hypothetical protein [Nitrososphaerota archaeon]
MAHHKLPNIAQKLETVKTIVLNTIEMIEDEKRYPVIMQQISKIHSELNDAEKLIVEDLVEDDLFKT